MPAKKTYTRRQPQKTQKTVNYGQLLALAIPLILGGVGIYVKGAVNANHFEETIKNLSEKVAKLETAQIQSQNNYNINRQGRTAEIKAINDDVTGVKIDVGIIKSKIETLRR